MITVRFCRARTRTHARARLHAHRAVPGWHAPSIIGMRDLQAAAARICVCDGGRGDCRQILPRTHSHTHARAHACMPTALCRDGTRGVSSACAICKLLLREYAYARGGRGDCRQILHRTHSHTHTHACMPTALCLDGMRGVSSARAICKLLLREYAFARGGGVIAVRFCTARTRTHARTRTLARPPRGAGIARAEHHRHARSASCCCEHMRMRGGEG